MSSIIEDLKYNFQKQDNGLMKLILINVIVFVFLTIVLVIATIANQVHVFNFLYDQLAIPAGINEFIYKPWTIITYSFSHSMRGVLHILMNMITLYWFGRLVAEYLGNRRLINLYLLGGIGGGLLYLLLFNTVPFFMAPEQFPEHGMIGASASVYAVVVGIATLIPDYTVFLILIGAVRIKYIAAFFVVLSLLLSVQENFGGNVAHLGGALIGYLYVSQLRKGRDLGKPINYLAKLFANIGKPKMKVTYRKDEEKRQSQNEQEEIDAILDKINRSGWQSLTKSEKDKLYKASNNNKP